MSRWRHRRLHSRLRSILGYRLPGFCSAKVTGCRVSDFLLHSSDEVVPGPIFAVLSLDRVHHRSDAG